MQLKPGLLADSPLRDAVRRINELLAYRAVTIPNVVLQAQASFGNRVLVGWKTNAIKEAVSDVLGPDGWDDRVLEVRDNGDTLVEVALRDPITKEWTRAKPQWGTDCKQAGPKGFLTSALGKAFAEWGIGEASYLGQVLARVQWDKGGPAWSNADQALPSGAKYVRRIVEACVEETKLFPPDWLTDPSAAPPTPARETGDWLPDEPVVEAEAAAPEPEPAASSDWVRLMDAYERLETEPVTQAQLDALAAEVVACRKAKTILASSPEDKDLRRAHRRAQARLAESEPQSPAPSPEPPEPPTGEQVANFMHLFIAEAQPYLHTVEALEGLPGPKARGDALLCVTTTWLRAHCPPAVRCYAYDETIQAGFLPPVLDLFKLTPAELIRVSLCSAADLASLTALRQEELDGTRATRQLETAR